MQDDRRASGAAEQVGAPRLSVTVPEALSPAVHGHGAFTLYTVSVQASARCQENVAHSATGSVSWICAKRYSEFVTLHDSLARIWDVQQATENAHDLPALPPKVWFGSSLDPTVVETRRELLEKFLQVVLLTPSLAVSELVAEFLQQPAHLLVPSGGGESTGVVSCDEHVVPSQDLHHVAVLREETEDTSVLQDRTSASAQLTGPSANDAAVANVRYAEPEPEQELEQEPAQEPSTPTLDLNGTCVYSAIAFAFIIVLSIIIRA